MSGFTSINGTGPNEQKHEETCKTCSINSHSQRQHRAKILHLWFNMVQQLSLKSLSRWKPQTWALVMNGVNMEGPPLSRELTENWRLHMIELINTELRSLHFEPKATDDYLYLKDTAQNPQSPPQSPPQSDEEME